MNTSILTNAQLNHSTLNELTFKKVKLATSIIFFLNGFIIASWVPHIPYVKNKLGLTASELGLALLCVSVGALFAMQFSGWLVSKIGTSLIAKLSAFFSCLIIVGTILSPSYLGLILTLIFLGIANGSLDIAMNTDGVQVEQGLKKPIMSFLHAMFSVGALTGAAIAVVSAWFGLSPSIHIVVVCGLGIAMTLAYISLRPAQWIGAKEMEKKFALPSRATLLVAVMTFVVLSLEGVITDWSGVYLTQGHNVVISESGIGYLIFAITMAAGRLIGDKLVESFGRRLVLLCSGIAALAGMTIVLSGSMLIIVCLGFAIVGIGLSNITPILFSIAGSSTETSPSVAVAAVTTFGYFGFLVSPPIVGFIADWKSIEYAFALYASLVLLIIFYARKN